MFFGNPMVEIALVSLVMSIVSNAMQMKFGNKKAMKENQNKMKEKQKRIRELAGKNDHESKKEADALQKEMLELMNASMQGSMKYMLFSFPVFIVVFWLLSMGYSGMLIQLPIGLPVIHRNWAFEITSSISWLWWYIYCSFISSIIISIVLKAIKK